MTFAPQDIDPGAEITDTGNAVQLVFSNTSSFTALLERDGAGRNINLNGSVSNIFGMPIIEDTNPNFEQVFIENDAPRDLSGETVRVDDFGENDLARAVLSIDAVEFAPGTVDNLYIGGFIIPLDTDFGPETITIDGLDLVIEFTADAGEQAELEHRAFNLQHSFEP